MSAFNQFNVHDNIRNIRPSDPVGAFHQATQATQQAKANAFNLQRAPVEAQQRDDSIERQTQVQNMGMIASAAYSIDPSGPNAAQQLDDVKASLRGVVPADELSAVTLQSLPGIVSQMRGLEGQISDERDMRDWQTGNQRFQATLAQRQHNADRSYRLQARASNRADAAASRGPAPSALQRRAMEGGLQPNTPEYQQFMLNGGASSAQGAGFRVASPEEAAQYGAAAGQIDESTGRFYAINPPKGMRISSDGQGGFVMEEGPGVNGGGQKPLTDAQSKSVIYATRARGALEALEPVAGALTSVGDRILSADPTGIARGALQSRDFQIAQQAGDEYLQAILRKDTGAAITSQEQTLYGGTFLPQPGDGEDVLQSKAASRERAILALEAGMSAREILASTGARGKQTVTGPASQNFQPPPLDSLPPVPQGMDPIDWQYMPEEGRRAFLEGN